MWRLLIPPHVRPPRGQPLSVQSPKGPASARPHGARTDQPDIEGLRNIGIVAHINAGKTTTTERILFNAGSTDTVGDVDRGNTVTDYLVQERDRGITITSAAVTYLWRRHRINLIDTPGHVDFTMEVERSLSILDGAVTILDASAGVEAQTFSVWNQARKYNLPNIIFLNKCDKPQADVKMCMEDLRRQLGVKANLIQLPVKLSSERGAAISSIIDLINRKLIRWNKADTNHGSEFFVEPLDGDGGLAGRRDYLEQVEMEREKLINCLADGDEELANHVILCDKMSQVSGDLISAALRRATIDCRISPVLVGSSFKFIGVQQLMDAIVDYLPAPDDRRRQLDQLLAKTDSGKSPSDRDACAFIFKIMHDKRLGALSYMRIYNGSVGRLEQLRNLETGKGEQIKKIYRAFADELREIEVPAVRDDIVVATGLMGSRTGDVLVSSNFEQAHQPLDFRESQGEDVPDTSEPENKQSPFQLLGRCVVLPKISRMEPVYFCSIESRSVSQQLKLEQALASMSREDPSLSHEIDSVGATTIRGMGKLHLEVVRDRIMSEYGVDAILGRLQISYRETIDGSANGQLTVDRLVNSVKNTLNISIYIRSLPKSGIWTAKKLRLDLSSADSSLSKLRQDHRRAIENGFKSALMHGPLMGYPVIDCDILLLDFKANSRCGLPLISSAASQCLTEALNRCSPLLLEPIMELEVVCPKEHNGLLMGDITSTRRGVVLSARARADGAMVIRSETPLSTLSNYSEFLRVTTSGRASFSMRLHSYSSMSEADKQSVVRL